MIKDVVFNYHISFIINFLFFDSTGTKKKRKAEFKKVEMKRIKHTTHIGSITKQPMGQKGNPRR